MTLRAIGLRPIRPPALRYFAGALRGAQYAQGKRMMLRAIGLRPIRPLARGYLTVRRADRTSLRLDTPRGATRICKMRP